jgi:heterotetrameric sarcosine oxidase gamma subunit
MAESVKYNTVTNANPSALHQAGIDNVELHSDTLQMKEIAGVSIIRLHSRDPIPQTNSGQFCLPDKTGQCSGDNPAMLCLRPLEWLLVSETLEAEDLLQRIQSQITSKLSSINDHSDGLALFRLSGTGAAWLLSKLSGLDYLAGVKDGEHCTRTKMGHTAVVVHYHQVGPDQFVFDLILDRSLAKYLWQLLLASVPHADELALAYGTTA